MTDIDVPQTREPVDIFAAIGIMQHGPTPFDDDHRLPVVIRVMQRVDEIAPVGFDKLAGVVHGRSYVRAFSSIAYPRPPPRNNADASQSARLPVAATTCSGIDACTLATHTGAG